MPVTQDGTKALEYYEKALKLIPAVRLHVDLYTGVLYRHITRLYGLFHGYLGCMSP